MQHKLNTNALIVSDKPKWFAGVNSLRFILALIVLLEHANNPIAKNLKESDFVLARYIGFLLGVSFAGVVAVIAFFIISGFVIHYPNKNKVINVKSFLIRRYLRVLIPLITLKILGIPFGSPENAVVWSLYCEIIYYTLYPLLSIIKISWNIQLLFTFLLAICTVLIGAQNDLRSMLNNSNINYNGNVWQLGDWLTWIIGLPSWLLGVRLAERIDRLTPKISYLQILLTRSLIFMFASTILILRFHFYVSYIFSLFVVSLPLYKWLEKEVCYYKHCAPNKYLENFGQFSYSLYLCHPLILALLAVYIPLNNFSYFVYIIVTVVISYLFYLLLEKPSHVFAQKLSQTVKNKPVL